MDQKERSENWHSWWSGSSAAGPTGSRHLPPIQRQAIANRTFLQLAPSVLLLPCPPWCLDLRHIEHITDSSVSGDICTGSARNPRPPPASARAMVERIFSALIVYLSQPLAAAAEEHSLSLVGEREAAEVAYPVVSFHRRPPVYYLPRPVGCH